MSEPTTSPLHLRELDSSDESNINLVLPLSIVGGSVFCALIGVCCYLGLRHNPASNLDTANFMFDIDPSVT